MNRHYRKYEPLTVRLRRMSRYPFAALSILFALLAAGSVPSMLRGFDDDAVVRVVLFGLPALVLAAACFVGYRWARGESSFWGVVWAVFGLGAVIAFFAWLSTIKLTSF